MAPKSILLVEDDPLDVMSVERSLKKLSIPHQLHKAYNGREALAMLRGDGVPKIDMPEIILLDLNMPKMNGVELLKELRRDPEFKHVSVFVMTTSGEEYDRTTTQSLGISGYIIKPLNFNDNSKRVSSMDSFMHFHILKILSH